MRIVRWWEERKIAEAEIWTSSTTNVLATYVVLFRFHQWWIGFFSWFFFYPGHFVILSVSLFLSFFSVPFSLFLHSNLFIHFSALSLNRRCLPMSKRLAMKTKTIRWIYPRYRRCISSILRPIKYKKERTIHFFSLPFLVQNIHGVFMYVRVFVQRWNRGQIRYICVRIYVCVYIRNVRGKFTRWKLL